MNFRTNPTSKRQFFDGSRNLGKLREINGGTRMLKLSPPQKSGRKSCQLSPPARTALQHQLCSI